MSPGYLEFLGIAADCLQVLLGMVLVVLLVRYHKSAVRKDVSNWPAAEAGPFRREFLLQSLKHQSELSFDSIEKTISTERRNLLRLFEIGDAHLESDHGAFNPEEVAPESFKIGDGESKKDTDQSSDRYQQVAQLAADGLKAPRIAKQLGIPRGEVELVLKMAAVSNSTAQHREMAVGAMSRRS